MLLQKIIIITNVNSVVGVYTVVGVVFSVLGTLIKTSSAGTGSNPTIGIQSLIVAVNFYRTLSVRKAFIESGKTSKERSFGIRITAIGVWLVALLFLYEITK
jgi:hypothetical protein